MAVSAGRMNKMSHSYIGSYRRRRQWWHHPDRLAGHSNIWEHYAHGPLSRCEAGQWGIARPKRTLVSANIFSSALAPSFLSPSLSYGTTDREIELWPNQNVLLLPLLCGVDMVGYFVSVKLSPQPPRPPVNGEQGTESNGQTAEIPFFG